MNFIWGKTHLRAAAAKGHSQAHKERDGDVATHVFFTIKGASLSATPPNHKSLAAKLIV